MRRQNRRQNPASQKQKTIQKTFCTKSPLKNQGAAIANGIPGTKERIQIHLSRCCCFDRLMTKTHQFLDLRKVEKQHPMSFCIFVPLESRTSAWQNICFAKFWGLEECRQFLAWILGWRGGAWIPYRNKTAKFAGQIRRRIRREIRGQLF